MPNIVLIGFMGTGKTTVGKILAKRLGMEFLDIDDLIEEEEGISIKEIFLRFGEQYFREKEAQVCMKVSRYDNYVIATGGGIVLNPINIKNLKRNGILIRLTASPEVIYERTSKSKDRPLLKENSLDVIRKLLEFREPYYQKATDWILDTSNLSISGVVDKIIDSNKLPSSL